MPIGIAKGLRVTKHNILENPILEKAHLSTGRSRGNLSHSQVQGLAKQLDLSERQIERWMRKRKQNDKPPALVKLTECGWRVTYYSFAFIYGLIVLYNKPFFWDINEAWKGYPHQVSRIRLLLVICLNRLTFFSEHTLGAEFLLWISAQLLLFNALFTVCRCQTEGLSRNVHPSRSHYLSNHPFMDVQYGSSRKLDFDLSWLLRHISWSC